MAKGKLILICQSGGLFVTNEDRTMSYSGGEANAANVTSETPFNDLKLNLAETCDLNQETATVKYFLPGNKRNLITVKNDKDVKRMIDFHGDALTAEVFVAGTPGFIRSAPDVQTNRQSPAKNDETVNNDNTSTKKDEMVKRGKAGPKKDKKVRKEDKVAKSPIGSPAKRTHGAIAAQTEESNDSKSENGSSTSDSSSSAASERVNENVDLDSECSSDYVPSSYAKRKKGKSDVNTIPADGVKKRKRTPSWKIGANGRPTIVSDPVGSKYCRRKKKSVDSTSGSRKSQRKSGRLAAKEGGSQEKKTGRKRGGPRAFTTDHDEIDEFVGPNAHAICDDDVLVDTLVSVWKSAITGADQEFTSVHNFQEVLKKYAMANDFEFKYKKNDTNRATGVCVDEGCSWKFNAVWVPSKKSFRIKTMNNVHTCDTKSRKNWLVNTIHERLQESPHLKPNEIANRLLRESGVESTPTQVFHESGIAKEQLHGAHKEAYNKLPQLHGADKEAYNKLPWFRNKIVETNPGSISNLVVGENKRFKALFVSFYASYCGFQNSCRPLLFLESTSLRSDYGEILLTANVIDGNDDFFTVAFCILDVEDDNNWRWFLEQLKSIILNVQPITFVFDREKSLKTSVLEVFGDAYIGYSIYHLLESFKRNVKGPFQGDGRSFLPVYFLAAVNAVRLGGFKKSIEQIKQISSQAYDWVIQIEPEHYTSYSFKGERYNHISDDIGGSLAKLMEDYQELPILHKIDALIHTMIDAITDAKLDGLMWSSHLTPLKEKELKEEIDKSCGLKVLISSDTLFEVREDSTHVVNLNEWSCTCLGWKETGLPCRHAIAVFALIGRSPYEFCSHYFTIDAYRLTYLEPINPVPIEKEECERIELENAGGEKIELENRVGENIELENAGGKNEETLKAGGEIDEGGEKMEVVEDNSEKIEVENRVGENIELENAGCESEETLKAGGEIEEGGEKMEVVEDNSEKMEVVEDNSEKMEVEEATAEKFEVENAEHETENKTEKEEGEKAKIEKVGGEKAEDEKVEVEKNEGEGEKGNIIEEDDDSDVFVLPPIPLKPVDVRKEKMEWEEAVLETKRTVTCTKCKQPGHNKKSCNLYQAAQQAC